MGDYVNPGFDKFEMSLNSDIYVDKSELIGLTNRLIRTESRFVCISRPRRFGKTMAANMLAAYYGSEPCDLFAQLKIKMHPSYEKHLNKYHVIQINVQEFLSKASNITELLNSLQGKVTRELMRDFSDVDYIEPEDFNQVMKDVYRATKKPFIILIDEWDCLFREYENDVDAQKKYLDFLRLWLKDQAYVGLAYMTGILPIKKYGSHSALNMFNEYSMIRPYRFLEFFGFTEGEVKALTAQYGMDFEDIKKWYNGYFVDLDRPIYNPRSVKYCLLEESFDSYWNNTETYESLKNYIKLDFDGLQEKVTTLVAGDSVEVNPNKFSNDMTTFNSYDDILTLLVHLGYLTYNFASKTVSIPNNEVKIEFINSIEDLAGWETVARAVKKSRRLLQGIWDKDAEFVARGIEQVHLENTSILQYNDENSLSCVIGLALYSSSEYYTTVRELPTGKGFSDIVFIPRKNYPNKPAIVIELKWDNSAKGAINQIKERNYPAGLSEYQGNMLLVGVNYDKMTKKHECVIEEWEV